MDEEQWYRMKSNKKIPGFRKEICCILHRYGSSVLIEFHSGDKMVTNFDNLIELEWNPAPSRSESIQRLLDHAAKLDW